MAVEERRRIALHRHAADSWGEEAADTLLELGVPAGHEPATRADIQALRTDIERLDANVAARISALEDRLVGTFERRISDAITAQTRALVFSQLGALVVIAALAFGLR